MTTELLSYGVKGGIRKERKGMIGSYKRESCNHEANTKNYEVKLHLQALQLHKGHFCE